MKLKFAAGSSEKIFSPGRCAGDKATFSMAWSLDAFPPNPFSTTQRGQPLPLPINVVQIRPGVAGQGHPPPRHRAHPRWKHYVHGVRPPGVDPGGEAGRRGGSKPVHPWQPPWTRSLSTKASCTRRSNLDPLILVTIRGTKGNTITRTEVLKDECVFIF